MPAYYELDLLHDVCHCECHRPGQRPCIFACCNPCLHCRHNIRVRVFDQHELLCRTSHANWDAVPNLIASA